MVHARRRLSAPRMKSPLRVATRTRSLDTAYLRIPGELLVLLDDVLDRAQQPLLLGRGRLGGVVDHVVGLGAGLGRDGRAGARVEDRALGAVQPGVRTA